ncbi:armadillo repeat-containing protein 3 isoform X3 [Nasonia vitripennis]|uniref:EDR1/CTR1/ARMC3-like peptidase-like domain-containing protein n=1 Tax=Nasonia vitripennis TaxID=7425 RepID=A0A7M7H404_NASVI|nr:armadillo repeat-containing protein 3 isoform X3 [Nasonia vitripennis]
MVKKNTKLRRNSEQRCISTSNLQPREDRAAEALTTFPPLSLEVRYPDTAILLLKSPEKPILLAAAAALAQYGEKARKNLEALFDLDITDSVLGLIRHEDVFTRRFALKLLALMSAVPNVRTHLLEANTYIEFFTEMLVSESDVFLQEFASRILAELSSDPSGSASFSDKFEDLSFLFEKIKAEDPDVKKNCMEIVVNLLKDFRGFDLVTRSKDLSFQAVYELFKQPYPIMQQLSLDGVERLVMHNADDWLQETFRRSDGLGHLLDILDQEEWKDLHVKALRVLGLACDNNKTSELMNSSDGTKLLLGFLEKTPDEELKHRALSILVRLADGVNGRRVLHSRGLTDHLLKYLEVDKAKSEVQATVCLGIAKMSQYNPANEEIARANPVNYILNLLNNEQTGWTERQTAAFALKELFSCDYQNCINFIDSDGQKHLMRMVNRPETDVPWETQVTVVQAISAIADYPSLAYDLIDLDLFSALCSAIEPDSTAPADLKIAGIDALCRFSSISSARRLLIHAKLPQKLCHLVTCPDHPIPVREAGIRLVLLLCAEPLFAQLCVQQGLLVCLLKNRGAASRNIPTWAACVEALFSADLPVKFAYTGRLALHDVTRDGFYAMRRSSCPFPVLEELFRLKLCPLEPIYVANFADGPEPDDEEDDEYLASKRAAFDAARATMRRESQARGIRVSEGTINAWLELKFGRLQPDPQLQSYLRMFRAELAVVEGRGDGDSSNPKQATSYTMSRTPRFCPTIPSPSLVHVSKISSRARLLGDFVSRQLSGVSPNNGSCVDQQLELHLRAIKDNIETSVIPLGQLRVGSYLERAMLFKVMADRIGLPACLVRGRYGRSWIEIASPMLSEAANDERLPAKFLRENYIVDLMEQPGDLIPIGSARSQRYREQRTCCDFTCCG